MTRAERRRRQRQAFLDFVVVSLVLWARYAIAAPDTPFDPMGGWAQFIRDVGFPIFIAGYLLFRLDGTMVRLTRAIEEALTELRRIRR